MSEIETQPHETLEKFGPTFQVKAIVCLMSDRPFIEQVLDIVNPKYFESASDQWIVKTIMWYFQEYRSLPTLEVFQQEVKKIKHDDMLRASVIGHLQAVFTEKNALDLNYIKNEFLKFCKNQEIKNAIVKSVDLLASAQYDQIKVLVDKAMHAGMERDIGHNWNTELALRVNKISRNTIQTPWSIVNHITDGGLGAGELGCIVAPSGIGKSWLLSAIGAHAAKMGKLVAHYTFELSQNYVGLRYDTIFTGIEGKEIRNNMDTVAAKMQEVTGQIMIKFFPTRTITVNAINAHIERMITLGFPPDLIIIDYADLMRSGEKSNARHEELGYIYEDIRGMLGERKLPGWTASQSQRSSLQDDIVEADKIAGAYSKIMVCDLVLSASRKVSDKMSNTARIHVIKNRFGQDGQTFPAMMDLAHGQIEVWDENSAEGMIVKQKMQSGDGQLKALMNRKLIEVSKANQDKAELG